MSENDLQKEYAGEKCMAVQHADVPLFFGIADGITCQINAIALGTKPGRSAYDAASNAATRAG